MKKLFLLPLLFICLASYGQRVFEASTLTTPYGADTTVYHIFYANNDSWSFELNSSEVDGVDTLYVYCTATPDTTSYALIWVDQDLDGSNDNPWTLSTTTNLLVYGDFWPCRYIVYKLAKGTSTAATVHYMNETKR